MLIRFILLALLSLASLHGQSYAALFENTNDAEFIQSLNFTTTSPPPPNPSFTSVDITFANGAQRGNVPVSENQFDLPSIALPVPCSCWSEQLPASVERRAAYFFTPDLPENNEFIEAFSDGIMIQSVAGETAICVNPIRKQLVTLTVTVFLGQQDCLTQPSLFPIVRRPPLIEKYLQKVDWNSPKPLPDPICLKCPPWDGYIKSMVALDKAHNINLKKALPQFIDQLMKLQNR